MLAVTRARAIYAKTSLTRGAMAVEIQTAFVFRTWGGKRKGAGRPKKGRGGVSHLRRPTLSVHHPVHVTLRCVTGLPSLRRRQLRKVIFRAFGAGSERFGFRLVHFSVQSNHVHLICEADDARALARGMQGLSIRLAKGLNRGAKRFGLRAEQCAKARRRGFAAVARTVGSCVRAGAGTGGSTPMRSPAGESRADAFSAR
jgi:REP element-mobilizing transposase RayT